MYIPIQKDIQILKFRHLKTHRRTDRQMQTGHINEHIHADRQRQRYEDIFNTNIQTDRPTETYILHPDIKGHTDRQTDRQPISISMFAHLWTLLKGHPHKRKDF